MFILFFMILCGGNAFSSSLSLKKELKRQINEEIYSFSENGQEVSINANGFIYTYEGIKELKKKNLKIVIDKFIVEYKLKD